MANAGCQSAGWPAALPPRCQWVAGLRGGGGAGSGTPRAPEGRQSRPGDLVGDPDPVSPGNRAPASGGRAWASGDRGGRARLGGARASRPRLLAGPRPQPGPPGFPPPASPPAASRRSRENPGGKLAAGGWDGPQAGAAGLGPGRPLRPASPGNCGLGAEQPAPHPEVDWRAGSRHPPAPLSGRDESGARWAEVAGPPTFPCV